MEADDTTVDVRQTMECDQSIHPLMLKTADGLRMDWKMSVDSVETDFRLDLLVRFVYRGQRELIVRPVTDREKLFGYELLINAPDNYDHIPIIDGDKNECVSFEAAVKRAFEELEDAEDFETIGGAAGVTQ